MKLATFHIAGNQYSITRLDDGYRWSDGIESASGYATFQGAVKGAKEHACPSEEAIAEEREGWEAERRAWMGTRV